MTGAATTGAGDCSGVAGASAGCASVGVAAAGLAVAGASVTGAAGVGATAGAVTAGAACEGTAFVETVPVTLVTELLDCSIEVPEGALVAGCNWACGFLRSVNVCSKAARATAWAGLSSARTEAKPVPTATHKPTKSFLFMKLSIQPKRKKMPARHKIRCSQRILPPKRPSDGINEAVIGPKLPRHQIIRCPHFTIRPG